MREKGDLLMSLEPLAKSAGLSAAILLFAGRGLVAQSPASAYPKIKADPGRAGVFVDGKYVGPAANFGAARKYASPPGHHGIRLVDPRYEEAVTTVDMCGRQNHRSVANIEAAAACPGSFWDAANP